MIWSISFMSVHLLSCFYRYSHKNKFILNTAMRISNRLHATVLPHTSISSIIPLLCNQHACRKSCIIHISILQCKYTFWHTGVPELLAFTHGFICSQASLWWISFLCNVSLVYFLYCNYVQTSNRCSSKV